MSDPKFYLGRLEDGRFEIPSTTFLTHAAVLGASGSGKTVVCKSIVEEALRNNIPVIAVDPKGDIGALGIGLGDFSAQGLLIHAQVEADDRGGGDPEEIAEEWVNLYEEKLEESFGDEPGRFYAPHTVATDSKGNIYVADVSYAEFGRNMDPPREIRSLQKLVLRS